LFRIQSTSALSFCLIHLLTQSSRLIFAFPAVIERQDSINVTLTEDGGPVPTGIASDSASIFKTGSHNGKSKRQGIPGVGDITLTARPLSDFQSVVVTTISATSGVYTHVINPDSTVYVSTVIGDGHNPFDDSMEKRTVMPEPAASKNGSPLSFPTTFITTTYITKRQTMPWDDGLYHPPAPATTFNNGQWTSRSVDPECLKTAVLSPEQACYGI
jgi:hypothetical protein